MPKTCTVSFDAPKSVIDQLGGRVMRDALNPDEFIVKAIKSALKVLDDKDDAKAGNSKAE